MIRRLVPSPALSIAILLMWLLMGTRMTVGQLVLGSVLALAIPHVAKRLPREFATFGRMSAALWLGTRILGDIVRANIEVARRILGPESDITPGWIWVPLDLANIHGIAALTSVITLTPGTVSAELSEDRRYLLVHVFNLKDPDAEIALIKDRYEAPLREIFP